MDLELLQQQKRVLIIDDDPDVTITLQKALEQNGFGTETYNDPLAAYKDFRYGQCDLVLLDIKMPVVDGFLLYRKIKSTDGKVKVCFLTASEFFYERVRQEHGLSGLNQETFLRIPIEINELVYTAKKLLDSE